MDRNRWAIVFVVFCMMIGTLALLQKLAARGPGATVEAPEPVAEERGAAGTTGNVAMPLPVAEPLPQGGIRVSAPPAFLFLPSTPEEDAVGMKALGNRAAALKPDLPAPASGKTRPEAGK